jgi:signal transduction histidine kinase
MGSASVLTQAPERRETARPEAGHAESSALRPDAGGRVESDLRRLADGLLKRMESDRAHVAAVLGDEIVSVMTMSRYLIEDAAQRLARGEREEPSEALQNASARIRDATYRLVALSCELRPRVLDDLGLVPALSWYFRDFSHENRAVFVSPRITVSESDVAPNLKLPIFRIVQAALSNVARHSKASAVRVFLSTFEDELRLGVEDNGVGFDVERWRHRRNGPEGCGLGMIQRWVELSGGRCSIEAIPRHGTRVQAFWRMPAAGGAVASSEATNPAAASGPG